MASDRYSRAVAFLKIVLPLIALGLLSTLFLISRAVKPANTIPFAEAEVQDRLTNQQVTGPYFSGTSQAGDEIVFTAERLQTPSGQVGANTAEDVMVSVDFADGANMMVEADVAKIDMAYDISSLTGNVQVVSSHGLRVLSDRLLITLSRVDITSPGKVRGETNHGTIDAGAMHVVASEGSSEAQWRFTKGVKMLYHPQKRKTDP